MENIAKNTVLNHPASLFVLFFTEMWERFSYYGMRALFVLFLTSSLLDGGWAWSREEALKLYGLYTGLVYLTPIIGGFLADKILGYRKAIIFGAILMTLGHISLAFETVNFFYIGCGLLILGNGLFKPNISSMVGQLYKKDDPKKDGGYTIFYMGINAGAFLGILLCGYIGEKIGWSYGFGLAGIFMLFGMLQFNYAQKIFGNIGLKPTGNFDLSDTDIKEEKTPKNVERDRLFVIIVFSFVTIFFWWAFEQAGGSMTIFAADYTDRVLEGSGAMLFKVFNTLLTIFPMLVITWVLAKLFNVTFKNYKTSNIFLTISFAIIWVLVVWMLFREFAADRAEIPASWFGILNSFFIISFAQIFDWFWGKKIIKSGPLKFALGLILLGIGFAILAYGSAAIPKGAATASVSIMWLILAYMFHTMGELCVSPVGLSYVSKLAPLRLIGMLFGVWFAASAVANWLGGLTGSFIDEISAKYSMSGFFLIFTVIPIVIGFVMILSNKFLKKKMHGIE